MGETRRSDGSKGFKGNKKFLLGGIVMAALWAKASGSRPKERAFGTGAFEGPDLAEGYNRLSVSPYFKLHYKWLAQKAPLRRGAEIERAIDIGCGSGGLAFEMAQLAPSLEVVGIDLSRNMVALAQDGARERGLGTRVRFQEGDAEAIPFPDGSFDMVVSTLSLHHWPQPIKVFNEVARVIKPGGRFMIFDLRRDMGTFLWAVFWLATRFFVPTSVRRAGGPLAAVRAAFIPREVMEMAYGSRLPSFRVAYGPYWLCLEDRDAP